jgi:hypothetical protein
MKRLIAALAGATMLIGTGSALAHSETTYTSDATPGGKAVLYHKNGFHYLKACDRQKDGAGVVAYASYHPGGRQNRTVDANGANGRCGKPSRFIANRTVWVSVRLADKENPGRDPWWNGEEVECGLVVDCN